MTASIFDGIILDSEPIVEQAGTAHLLKEKARLVLVSPGKGGKQEAEQVPGGVHSAWKISEDRIECQADHSELTMLTLSSQMLV